MRERREEEVVDTKDSKVMVACWSRDVIFFALGVGGPGFKSQMNPYG